MSFRRTLLWGGLFVATSAGALVALQVDTSAQGAADERDRAVRVEAVEPDMHEFMEYVFEPGYKRLQTAMATEPADNAGWKPIKGDGLALAEAANLLVFHRPEAETWTDQHEADWLKHTANVRDAGGRLYLASKKRDFKSTRAHYETMLKNCNACHTQFADGEHQLTP
jgi:hypothetical protein